MEVIKILFYLFNVGQIDNYLVSKDCLPMSDSKDLKGKLLTFLWSVGRMKESQFFKFPTTFNVILKTICLKSLVNLNFLLTSSRVVSA